MTVAELVAEAAAELGRNGVPSSEWDAERLLRHVLAVDRASLLASPQREVAAGPEQAFRRLVSERARRVPLQHLVGYQSFWKHEFRVTRDVLIPRPETELLVETALSLLRGRERPLPTDPGSGRGPVLVDVGTGSGCVALSLAAELGEAEVHATEISAAALVVARENAQRLGLAGRVTFHLGRLLEPLPGLEVDLVVSNPPYVDPAERDGLEPEVRDHEPALALFPPGDALAVYRELVPAAFQALRPGGSLAVEIAPTLAAAVSELLGGAGFRDAVVLNDLAGRPRVVRGRRPVGRAATVG